MLDQVKRTTCFRNQHIAGGKGRVQMYVKMNINYDQMVSNSGGEWPVSLNS